MKRFLTGIILLLPVIVYAQFSGNPSQLRVRVDSTGALLASATAQTNPVTSCTFNQCRLSVDASGNLLVVVSAGGTPTFTSITTPLVIGGTTASSTLTLESTSGTGTTDAIIFKIGSQVEAARFNTSGQFGIGAAPTNLFYVSKSVNDFGTVSGRIENTNTGSGAYTNWDVTTGNNQIRIYVPSQNVALQKGFIVTSGTMGLTLGVGNAGYWTINGTTGFLLADQGNNISDIGDSAGTGRPRTLYLGTSIVAPLHVSTGTGLAVANVGANSCGTTAASVAGGSNAFVITVGATSGTQCRVAFPVAATTEYTCAANDDTTTVAVRVTPVDTTHTDFIGTFTAADKISAICFSR